MSKKKSNKDDNFEEFLNALGQLADQLEAMSPEERQILDKMATGKMDFVKEINDLYYDYKKPDYESLIVGDKRVISWPGPFWNAQDDDDPRELCEFVANDANSLAPEQQRNDIRDYLYRLYSDFDRDRHENVWKFYGPMWMLERLHRDNLSLPSDLDIAIEALRQDGYFYEQFLSTDADYMAAVLYQLGWQQLPALLDFLNEGGRYPLVKPIAFDAIVLTALNKPERRLQAVSALATYLNRCYNICLEGASPVNIPEYAHSLATAHIRETLPLLKKIYNSEIELPPMYYNNFDDVSKAMGDNSIPFKYSHSSLDDYMHEESKRHGKQEKQNSYDSLMDSLAELYGEELRDDDDYDDDDYYDPMMDGDKAAKPFYITAELQGAPERVSRALRVPSNIYLTNLAEVLLMAFTSKNDIEEIPLFRFTDNEGNELDILNDETLIDYCKTKGDTLWLETKHNKEIWRHKITLDKVGRKFNSDDEFYLDITDAKGAYPSKSCKSLADYAKKFAAARRRRKPNIDEIYYMLTDYEEAH